MPVKYLNKNLKTQIFVTKCPIHATMHGYYD